MKPSFKHLFENLAEATGEGEEALNPRPKGTAVAWGIYGKAIANGKSGLACAYGTKSIAIATGPNGKANGALGARITLAYWENGKKIGEKTGLVVSDSGADLPNGLLRPWVIYTLNSKLEFCELKHFDDLKKELKR
jgi:hypothetical protein